MTMIRRTLTSLPMALVLLIVPATASAFLQCISNRNHAPRLRETMFTLRAARDSRDGSRIDELNKMLMERRRELLSDASNLREIHSRSAGSDRDEDGARDALSPERMAREVLLSSRLSLPFLRRTRLGPSGIDGAGRGLFAAEDIAEGEVITCYPGDVVLCEMPSSGDGEGDQDFEKGDEDYEDADFDEGYDSVDGALLWGAHVPNGDRWDDDAVFDGTGSAPPLTSYAVSVDDVYSVMGHPSLDDDPAYYGHFANDGAGHLALEKPNSQSNIEAALELGLDVEGGMGVEENIAAYVLKSFEVANGMHKAPDEGESHMVTVATRDIKEGDEIFVTYGPDYWAGYA